MTITNKSAIASGVTQRPPVWKVTLKTAAIPNAGIDVGRFNAIMNMSGTAYGTIVVETAKKDASGNAIIVGLRNVQPGAIIPILGSRILKTGQDEDDDTVTTDSTARLLAIGRY